MNLLPQEWAPGTGRASGATGYYAKWWPVFALGNGRKEAKQESCFAT